MVLPVSVHGVADFVSVGVTCKAVSVHCCVACTSFSCNSITLLHNLQIVLIIIIIISSRRKISRMNNGIVVIHKSTTTIIIMEGMMIIMVLVIMAMSPFLYNRSGHNLLAEIQTSTLNVHWRLSAFCKSHRCWCRVHCRAIEVAEIAHTPKR